MSSRALPNLGLKAFYDLGEDGWKDEQDLNLLLLSVLVQGGVISTVSATPGSPTNGDVYLFDGTHPTQANKIAIRDAGAWIYVTPLEGWQVYDRSANSMMRFDGAAWAAVATAAAPPYSVPFGFGTTTPGASEIMLIHVFAEAVDFADDWVGSVSYVGTNPTSNPYVFDIQKNGVSIGSISITSAGVVTFSTTGGATSFAAGDRLRVVAAAGADATLASSAFTFKGTRP